VLAASLGQVAEFLGEDSERARTLRQSSPFAGALGDMARCARAGRAAVTRAQLEHVIRAAATIPGDHEIVVVGSQAILGRYPQAPAELCVSAARQARIAAFIARDFTAARAAGS
jgi:hypothetical protein